MILASKDKWENPANQTPDFYLFIKGISDTLSNVIIIFSFGISRHRSQALLD
jgi:hypothetical protein